MVFVVSDCYLWSCLWYSRLNGDIYKLFLNFLLHFVIGLFCFWLFKLSGILKCALSFLAYVECEWDLRLLTAVYVDGMWMPQWLNSIQGLKALEISYLICKGWGFFWCLLPYFFFPPKLAFSKVENDPHLKLMYTECLRLCGTWLAETCLENPTVIMQKYLEKVRLIFEIYNLWDNAVLKYSVKMSSRFFSAVFVFLYWKYGFLYKYYGFTLYYVTL